jgi:hypothetical protein
MTIDSTVAKAPFHMRGGAASGAALFCFFFGFTIFVLIPYIGWIVGALIMIASAGVLGFLFYHGPTYVGNCPYCGTRRLAGEPGTIGKCTKCQNHFVHRDGLLVKDKPA